MKKSNIIYGIHPVSEAIQSGKDFDKILIQRDISNPQVNKLRKLAKQYGIKAQNVPDKALNKITGKNHQGVVGFILPIELTNIEQLLPMIYEKGEDPFFLILDKISDVRNFGAISRTAECAGVHGLVIPAKGAAQINEDALKTSSGALSRIPVCREEQLAQTIRFLKDSGLKIVACTEKSETDLFGIEMKGPLAIIMGSEDKGISEELLRLADEKAAIPMQGETASLNVSVAAAITLFESVRQRRPA